MEYLIHAPNYKRTSGGVRVLHKLCHLLNECGYKAYVPASVVNPDWNTPVATTEVQQRIGADGIVVYPEVIRGNPWNAKRVVRYILNYPGLLGGDKEYESNETLFCYCGLWRRFVPSNDRVLTVPIIDTGIFYNDYDTKRSGGLYWVGPRGKLVPRISETSGLTEITHSWPSSWGDIAALFRRSEVFYSYTDYAGLLTESRLCGCPAVIVSSSEYTWEDIRKGGIGGIAGLAMWDRDPIIFADNLRRAQETVDDYFDLFNECMDGFSVQLERFVEITQEIK